MPRVRQKGEAMTKKRFVEFRRTCVLHNPGRFERAACDGIHRTGKIGWRACRRDRCPRLADWFPERTGRP